jgi:polysaccharide deacetylase 2 family uncharacterized protein YibQ
MVFVSAREVNHTTEDATQPIGGPGWESRFPERVEAVTAAINRAALTHTPPVEEAKGTEGMRWLHRRYRVRLKPEERETVQAVIEDLRGVDPGLTVSPVWIGEGVDLRIGLDGLLTHTLELRWGDATPVAVPAPQIAMIVSTLGDDLRTARELVDLEASVGLAVRPFRPFSKEVAELAHHFEREVWLDMTMAPEDPASEQDPPTSATEQSYVDSALLSVPYAVGVAHDRAAVESTHWSEAALEAAVKQRKLLYVVGTRSPRSGVQPQTLLIGLEDENGAGDALTNLGHRAQSEGSVIGIGAGGASATEALRRIIPEWRKAGVDVVPASQLVQTVH